MMKRLGILIVFAYFAFSCNTTEEKEDKYAGRHIDFVAKDEFFIGKEFDYRAANQIGYELAKRTEAEIESHRPEIKVLEKGAKIEVNFPRHPNKPGHYWAWIEAVDKVGTEIYKEMSEPKEAVDNFQFVLTSENPFKLRVRIRAFCHVHGEFEFYFDLPEFKEKSLIE